jgi:hypothetical protein
MEAATLVEHLDRYVAELREILSRFKKGDNFIHIADADQPRLQQLVLELRDLFDDAIGRNTYSEMLVDAFNEGVSNIYSSSSYASVERLISITSAARTRAVNNPSFLQVPVTPQPTAKASLELPDKVTLKWLFNHVPYRFWLALVGIAAASFIAGVTAASRLPVVQQWFGICPG